MIPARLARVSAHAAVAFGVALSLVPLTAGAAVGAPGHNTTTTSSTTSTSTTAAPTTTTSGTAPSLEGGAFGTWLNQFNLTSPYGSFNYGPAPAVVTPPNGGTATARGDAISFGGNPPYIPPYISEPGPTGAETYGAIQGNLPSVQSAAGLCSPGANMNMNNNGGTQGVSMAGAGFCNDGKSPPPALTIQLGSGSGALNVQVSDLVSACQAFDQLSPTSVAAATYAKKIMINGQSMPAGQLVPNTKYVETYPTTTGTGTLTLVFNEQVPGQSGDHHPGILVNALHVYVNSPDTSYTNVDSAMFSESRCEVGIIPIPPGIIPESPLAVALPISAIGAGGVGIVALGARRRRRYTRKAVA